MITPYIMRLTLKTITKIGLIISFFFPAPVLYFQSFLVSVVDFLMHHFIVPGDFLKLSQAALSVWTALWVDHWKGWHGACTVQPLISCTNWVIAAGIKTWSMDSGCAGGNLSLFLSPKSRRNKKECELRTTKGTRSSQHNIGTNSSLSCTAAIGEFCLKQENGTNCDTLL